ncbi:type IVB secretion system protein IcmH/DotU [Pseudoalteromonas fenneropenaei]|uniref:type IVB secretion system protein IcmH/DotU n=1 Tax=Pseudoalteromonas fenneropenaei TaxID=1737459 RepID=UPI003611A5DD
MFMETSKQSDYLACISPIINELAVLSQVKKQVDSAVDCRERLLSAFDHFEKQCYSQQVPASAMQEMKFALTALVDERILTSNLDFKMEWMSRPLQLEFFGSHRGGEAFFEKLDALRKGGDTKLEVLSVYYVCLQMGFEGVYKIKGVEQLKALMVDIRAQLEDAFGAMPRLLSDNGVPAEGFAMKVGRNVPYWVIMSVCLSVVVMLFVGFHFVTDKQARNSNQEAAKHQAVLEQLDKAGQ